MKAIEEHLTSIRKMGTSSESQSNKNLSELETLAKKLDAIKRLTYLLKRNEIPLDEKEFLEPVKERYKKGAVSTNLIGNAEVVTFVGALVRDRRSVESGKNESRIS